VRHGGFALALLLELLIGLVAQPARAHGRHLPLAFEPPKMQKAVQPERAIQPPGKRNNVSPKANIAGVPKAQPPGGGRALAGLPPKWVERLREVPPEEQERFLENNQQFHSLPPWRQTQIRRNLENWNRLSTAERNAIRGRERIWEQMSPEQRQFVKNVLLPQWQQMPPQRKQLINGRLRTLQGMSPPERQAALDDPRFMQGLSLDEQSVLRNLNSLRNPPAP
jgi:Protein of unknown function (DUF3106)